MLCVGIGGGGDVVGALAVGALAEAFGAQVVLGGTTWERRPIDPLPGPRRLDELTGAEPLGAAVALAGRETRGPGGFRFAEARMAEHLGAPTLLVDPNPGADAVADGLAAAASRLECDLVALVDVGGDVLAHGDEPGLASPLCDAVLLAAGARLGERMPVFAAVVGAGCDGELTPAEVLDRLAEVAAADGSLGAWGLDPPTVERMAAAVTVVPTEASAQVVACARGERGTAPIRGGRRMVERSPLGAVAFCFDPAAAVRSAARLAAAVPGAGDLEAARDALAALGVSTELDLERRVAAAG